MFNLIPGKRGLKKAVGGDGGALAPFGFPLSRRALFPEFDRLFDGFLSDWEPIELKEMVRKVEVEEKADAVIVRAEAPGFKPEV
jgi:HSP20 family molecular chaperone IbpA